MKLYELDAWYKEYENSLDALRHINWSKLAHAEKLVIYESWIKETKDLDEISHRAARKYHSRPEVIQYFKDNKLLHESGDYRK